MAMEIHNCPVCKLSLEQKSLRTKNDNYNIQCHRCGTFSITRTAAKIFSEREYTQRQRAIASSIIYKNAYAVFTTKDNEIFEAKDINTLEKCDKLLLFIEKKAARVGDCLYSNDVVSNYEAQATSWAIDWVELSGLLELLVEMGRLSAQRNKMLHNEIVSISIAGKGWERLEELYSTNIDSKQGFVAMWFSEKMQSVYDKALAPAIKNAGYLPLKVDDKEHAGKIDDEIIRQIRRSRFLVADATGHRGGVYYEAGFAHGLGLPVFWTCRKNAMKDLHFDVRQYNCLIWEENKLEEFEYALSRRIEAVLGQGPVKK
jgi:nucleoside 2-deoxyribosyltransferase